MFLDSLCLFHTSVYYGYVTRMVDGICDSFLQAISKYLEEHGVTFISLEKRNSNPSSKPGRRFLRFPLALIPLGKA